MGRAWLIRGENGLDGMETVGDTEILLDQTWLLLCEHPDFKMEYDKNGLLLNAILFLVLFGDLALSCPTNCKFCSTGLAECTQISSLEEVLTALPTQTEKVLFRKGTASHIPSEAFQNFSNLNVLSITEFPISSLKNHTFLMRDSERFQFLDLSSNQLTSCGVEASSFTGLKNLTDFTLTNNKLDNLKKSWFFDMWQLQKLNLAFNFISYLPPHTFDNLWKLQKLNLSSNGILYISTGSFFGLLSLTDLDLSSNDMVFINTDAFEPLVSVKHIDVSHNRLKTLPDFPKLVASLLLQNNSWHCSCQFVQLLERLKDKLKDSRTVTCSSPEEANDSPALMAYAMVCSSNTTDEVLPTITSGPRESSSSWIYGFIGGLLLGFILFMILWLIRKVIKQGILKNPAIQGIESGSIRDKKSSIRLSVTQHDPFSASPNLGFGLRQGDQDDMKTPQPVVNLDDVPQNPSNNETDTVGRIRLCKTAPSLLPAPDVFTSSSWSKGGLDAIKLRDSLKYFETDQVDQVTLPPKEMTVHTEVFNLPRGDYYNSASATVNLENPGEMFVKYSTARRSKTWSNLCLNSSSPSSVDHQSTKCTTALTNLSGFTSIKATGPMTEVHTKKTGEGPGILEEGPRKTGFGLIQDSDDSFSTKIDSCFSNDAFEDNVWCYKTQKNNIQEPGEENTHASESSDSSFLSSLAKSSWAEKDHHHPHDLEGTMWQNSNELGFAQPNNNASPSGLFKVENSESSSTDQFHRHFQMTRHSSNKQKVEGSTWTGELLTRERFWKYHTNCCDEYRPCPTARKVIKRLRNAKVIESEGADDITRPPCDLELLKNNEVLEMNLLVKLQEREERKRRALTPWK
ncbi:uncharacterized protein LOC120535478 [Polypterus senegalus]